MLLQHSNSNNRHSQRIQYKEVMGTPKGYKHTSLEQEEAGKMIQPQPIKKEKHNTATEQSVGHTHVPTHQECNVIDGSKRKKQGG